MKYDGKFRIDDRSQRDISSMAAMASLSGSCLSLVSTASMSTSLDEEIKRLAEGRSDVARNSAV